MIARIKHIVLVSIFMLACFFTANATHNRAGEITYLRIAPFFTVVGGVNVPVFTYSITLIKYTDDGSLIADRCTDTIYFGDGNYAIVPRINGPITIGDCNCGVLNGVQLRCGEVIITDGDYRVKRNIYTTIYTFPGAGTYKIRSADPNRNANVHNMAQSVNQMFYVESLLIIDNFTGANSSPIFSFPPIDKACRNVCFEHNPGAFDPDGDSLSYEMSTPRGVNGQTVPGYFDPETGAGGSFSIHPTSGLLSWCKPQFTEEYNIAFIVREWRKNTSGDFKMIGYVLRDMQVIVNTCPNNQPPQISAVEDICVEAGQLVSREITISDPNTHTIVNVSGGGGAFAALSPIASINPTVGVTNSSNGFSFKIDFKWQTNCEHVRDQVYSTTLKAQDNGVVGNSVTEIKLVSFKTFNIRVVPPSVKNVTATPIGSALNITWSKTNCNPKSNKLLSYKIYRKNDCSPFAFDPCTVGVPSTSGYELIGEVSPSESSFLDNNDKKGLIVGQSYSYIVVAVYEDGLQSFGSTQVCAELKRDVPVIINVDVLSTSTTGSVLVNWVKPLTTDDNLDLNVYKGPYRFDLKHRINSTDNYVIVYTTTKTDFSTLEETFTHGAINTEELSHEYKIDFYSDTTKIGSSSIASSIFLKTEPSDRRIDLSWNSLTPWKNTRYTVYRRNPESSNYVIIGDVNASPFVDTTNIENKKTYCYYVRSEGAYGDSLLPKPLFNRSQEVCVTAIDKTPPTFPTLTVAANCPTGMVEVTWQDLRLIVDDVAHYELYYKPTVQSAFDLAATINASDPLVFRYDGLSSIAGCYAIKSIDINGNVGELSPDFCIDNCPVFELPNVFSPNGDGINDFFKAIKVRQIETINLSVTDRWGNLVFQTTDPFFTWDGISQATGNPVSEGTFFVVCDVFEPRLTGTVTRNIHGYLQVVR